MTCIWSARNALRVSKNVHPKSYHVTDIDQYKHLLFSHLNIYILRKQIFAIQNEPSKSKILYFPVLRNTHDERRRNNLTSCLIGLALTKIISGKPTRISLQCGKSIVIHQRTLLHGCTFLYGITSRSWYNCTRHRGYSVNGLGER